ncbi:MULTISPECIES: hypothetical protein [unclassified Variovorax]|uniref:hypothetical protein n=1 Tax=unclassified Variovorax TaxID=663243 RepID=UPI00076D5FF3|nr:MULTISPECIES: hypothetical protein [unclassified Variovorax]KWT98195.1 hypothetical protein APY03_0866 [Variovorax sp. WDL1]PNG50313.1 hypothetical protein CHC06_05936 [Variovorax sp. B2]PNG51186.1 hypothetical protein CHC07_05842 [Variovorax sp. B4]VTV17403.1 hypothetical protein WDL1P1_00363 [Variovorax sp. WDL1]
MRNLERELCGPEGSVYPGHPVTIAVLIMRKYASLAEANELDGTSGFKMALTDSDIPGAGGQVHMALGLLKDVAKLGPEQAFSRGRELWSQSVDNSYRERERPGQALADKLKPMFLELAATWPAESPESALS